MKWAGLTAFIVGLALFFLSDSLKFQSSEKTSVGQVIKLSGEVLGKHHTDSFFSPLKAGSPISENFKIRTSFDSQALIEYGEKFWMRSSSVIRLEKQDGRMSVHLISGTLQRESIGKTLFYIDGEQILTKELIKGGITELTNLPIQDVSMDIENPDRAPEALNKRQIYQTFKLHQRFIEKCFIKHYARKEGQTQSGKVWVSFNVSESGRLKLPKIEKSDYSDIQFHSCLKEVVSRVQMKNYKGPKMQIKFPINIELPE